MDTKENNMKKYLPLILKYLPWLILSICLILLVRQCGEKPRVEYVEVEVEVLVPSVEKVFDTIYEPTPKYVKVKEIDSTYYKKYTELIDEVAKDSIFKEAITVNEYNETFSDTLQTIQVYSKTRGQLIAQSVKYVTNPYSIKVKETVEIKKRSSLSIGSEIGMPTINLTNPVPILKANAILTNKRGNTFSISYDTEGRAWVGKSWKIRLRK